MSVIVDLFKILRESGLLTAAFIIGAIAVFVAIVGNIKTIMELSPSRAFALAVFGIALMGLSVGGYFISVQATSGDIPPKAATSTAGGVSTYTPQPTYTPYPTLTSLPNPTAVLPTATSTPPTVMSLPPTTTRLPATATIYVPPTLLPLPTPTPLKLPNGEIVTAESLARNIGGNAAYWTVRGPVVWGYWDKGHNATFRHPGGNTLLSYWSGFPDPRNADGCTIAYPPQEPDTRFLKCPSGTRAEFDADGVGFHIVDYTGYFR